jgi:hypothetical protein
VWFKFLYEINSNQEKTMAGLSRTNLTASQKATLSGKAFAGKGRYGAMMELADTFGVSRPTVYSAGAEAEAVLAQHFQNAQSSVGVVPLNVDEAQIRRTIVALRCRAPNSLRAIEDLLPILYPGVKVSYGWIQKVCVEAEMRAGLFNALSDLSGIRAGALDEMFSQGDPVLAGVDLDSGYLFGLSLRDSRSADDWEEVLSIAKGQGLSLEVVVKDAAKGIEAGVNRVFPDAEQRDDAFHAGYEMGKVLRRLEKKAFGLIAQEQEFENKIEKTRRTGRGDRKKLASELGRVRRRCRLAIEMYDRFEQAVRQVEEAMEFVDLNDLELRDAETMRVQFLSDPGFDGR